MLTLRLCACLTAVVTQDLQEFVLEPEELSNERFLSLISEL